MAKRKRKQAGPAVAVIIDRKAWREWQALAAELGELVPAARDMVLQLRELLLVKQRQKQAGHKAAETRAAQAQADDGTNQPEPAPPSNRNPADAPRVGLEFWRRGGEDDQ